MIGAMSINEKVLTFIGKYFPEEILEEKNIKKKTGNMDEEIALAIVCAVHNTQKI